MWSQSHGFSEWLLLFKIVALDHEFAGNGMEVDGSTKRWLVELVLYLLIRCGLSR